MRNFRSLIIGGLIGAALFLVFNCAGYVMVALVGSRIVNPDDQRPDASAANPPADVVVFSTPTATLAAANLPPAAVPLESPLPLLPTVTPGLPLETPVQAEPAEPTPSDTPPPPTPKATLPSLSKSEIASQLEIMSHQSYVDDLNWHHLVGEVQNTGDTPIEYVQVLAKYYNTAGEIISTKLTFTAPDTIFPGGKAPFDIVTLRKSQWQAIDTYTLEVTGDVAASLLNENLVLANQNSWIEDGFLYVQGQVENVGELPALVKLIVTLYDASGAVINTNWSYADSGIIKPGDSSSFVVRITHQTDPNNYSYRIQIEDEVVEGDIEDDFTSGTK
ncbi:MAG: FxLYD domain-containing protein [Anaerolineae bacterium]|nr:FxLYD domain-containing protein [Anaerolineae bacterium]